MTHVTIVKNSATNSGGIDRVAQDYGKLKLRNSIVACNTGGLECGNSLEQNESNFIYDDSCSPALSSDDGSLNLGGLTGSPAYYPLLNGSVAIDAGDSSYCNSTDQAGSTRPYPDGGSCDLGAFERQTASATYSVTPIVIPTSVPTPTITPTPTPANPITDLTATVGSDGLTITWTAPGTGIESYLFTRSPGWPLDENPSLSDSIRGETTSRYIAGSEVCYLDTDITTAGDYHYRIRVQRPTISGWSGRLSVEITETDLATISGEATTTTPTNTPEPMTCVLYYEDVYLNFPASNYLSGSVSTYTEGTCDNSIAGFTSVAGLVYSTEGQSSAEDICDAQIEDDPGYSARNPVLATNTDVWECYLAALPTATSTLTATKTPMATDTATVEVATETCVQVGDGKWYLFYEDNFLSDLVTIYPNESCFAAEITQEDIGANGYVHTTDREDEAAALSTAGHDNGSTWCVVEHSYNDNVWVCEGSATSIPTATETPIAPATDTPTATNTPAATATNTPQTPERCKTLMDGFTFLFLERYFLSGSAEYSVEVSVLNANFWTCNRVTSTATATAMNTPTATNTAVPSASSQDVYGLDAVSNRAGELTVSWNAPSDTPVDYRIAWARASENYKTWSDGSGNAFPTSPSYTITDLDHGTPYKVQVRARYNGSSGPWTGSVEALVMDATTEHIHQVQEEREVIVAPSDTPTATATAVPPTATPTPTSTPVPPTAIPTATNTPVPPSAANTPVPTATNTPEPAGRTISNVRLSSSPASVLEVIRDAPDESRKDYRVNWAKVADEFPTWTDLIGNAFPTSNSCTITGLDAGALYKVRVRARYHSGGSGTCHDVVEGDVAG